MFLIKCTCGHQFWRSHPCQKNLRPWECPKRRSTIIVQPLVRQELGFKADHVTTLSTMAEQMAAAYKWRQDRQADARSSLMPLKG